MKNGLLIFLVALPSFAFSQVDFNQGIIVQKNFCDTIPIEYVREKILIPVVINGENKKFLFDTGATLIISEQIQSKMKNKKYGKIKVTDIYKRETFQTCVKVEEIQIGKLIFQNTPSLVLDQETSGLLSCYQYDGVIGSNLLRNCIFQLDLEKKILILTDKIENLNTRNAFQTLLKTLDKQNSPFLEINFDNKIKFDAQFNTGNADFISISKEISDKSLKAGISKVINYGFATTTNSSETYKTKIERIMFDNIQFRDAKISNFVSYVYFYDNTYNHVGVELAEYGTVTIDFINKRFYFAAKETKQFYKYQKTIGFNVTFFEDQYLIISVMKGSPAEKNGLKNGYQVLKFNDLDVSKPSSEIDCKLYLTKPVSRASKVKVTYKNYFGKTKTVELTEE